MQRLLRGECESDERSPSPEVIEMEEDDAESEMCADRGKRNVAEIVQHV